MLHHLHHRSVIHGDIYCKNILLRLHPRNLYRIPDFVLGGFSKAKAAYECEDAGREMGRDVFRFASCVYTLLCCGKPELKRNRAWDVDTGYETSGLSKAGVSQEVLDRCLRSDEESQTTAMELCHLACQLEAQNPRMFRADVEFNSAFYETVV